ncbi:DeoR/GlpR transcriptional regulator [Microbacterium jejuense]|uniref:Lactose phosphotransferase system repressor n=1 Tax=Microbacterium jejuense TaxID=1263637 RepID=A0ABS7HRS7_9MICO|nr:DeoR/GlpR family DNA-binding transcription regulator [Microbacterium jejuense]MBW9095677.1 DeoR/GlpR transcriptional regulator [Microbacterium jejuense]
MRYTGAPERRAELERLVTADGYIASADVAHRLGVSEMTVRRDLRLLEEEGVLRRVAGGATVAAPGLPFERRDAVGAAQKRAIAGLAAAEAAGADVVALDAGTTVAAVAPLLHGSTIVTHSLPVIESLSRDAAPQLIAAGGHYQPDTRAFAGPLAEETLRGVRCDVALLSATAVGLDGLWGTNVLDAAIKRVLAAQSDRVVLLADADKLERTSAVRIAALDIVDTLITDARAHPDTVARFAAAGIDVRIAG